MTPLSCKDKKQMMVSTVILKALPLQRSRGSRTVTTAQKKLNVAINGFGRIGRNFLRCVEGRENSLLNIVVINDSGKSSIPSVFVSWSMVIGQLQETSQH